MGNRHLRLRHTRQHQVDDARIDRANVSVRHRNNRLTGASGAINYSLQYDAYGNVTNNGQYSFVFNDASQLVSVPTVSGLTYKYDGNGKRARTTVPGGDIYYVYSQAGRLMYQTDTAANSSTEFFYAADRLVAKRDFGTGVNPDLDGDGLPNHIEVQLGLPNNNPADAAGTRTAMA